MKVKNVDSCDNAALHLGGLMGEHTVTYHVECLSADSDQVSQDWRTAEEWTASLIPPRGEISLSMISN